MPRTFLVRRTALQIQSSSTESEDDSQFNSFGPSVNQNTDSNTDEVCNTVSTSYSKEDKQTIFPEESESLKSESSKKSPTFLSRAVSSVLRVDTVTGAIANNTLLESTVKQETVDTELDAEVAYHTDRSFSSYSSDKQSFCRSESVTSIESTGSYSQDTARYSDISAEASCQDSDKTRGVSLALPLIAPHQPLPPFASLVYNVFSASKNPVEENMPETITMKTERSSVIKLPLRLPLQSESDKENYLQDAENSCVVQNKNVQKDTEVIPNSKSEGKPEEETDIKTQQSNEDINKSSETKSAPKIWNPFHHVYTPKSNKVLPLSLNTNTPVNHVVNSLPSQQQMSPSVIYTSPFVRNPCAPSANLTSSPMFIPEYRSPNMERSNYNLTDMRQSPHLPGITSSFQTIQQINAAHNMIPEYSPRISSPFLAYKPYHTPESYVPNNGTPSRTSTPVVSPIPTTPVVKMNDVPNLKRAHKRPCTPVIETPKRIRTDNLPFQIFNESPSPIVDPSLVKLPYTCAVTSVLKPSSRPNQENHPINLNRTPLSHLQPIPAPHPRSPGVLGQSSLSKENIPDSKENIISQVRKNQQTPQNIEVINGGYGIKNPSFVAPKPSDITNVQKDENGNGSFVCKVCGKEFGMQRLLNRHLKCHSEAKRYLCTFCGKGFNDTFDLKRHTRIHTGVKPYKCQHCEKAFTQRCSLESHCRKVHSMELNFAYKQRRNKTYVCEDCGHSTTDPEVHFIHLKERHPNCPALAKPHDKRHFKFQANDRPSSGPLRPRN